MFPENNSNEVGRGDSLRPVFWENDSVGLIDQRLLPRQLHVEYYRDPRALAAAITQMVVRGAPAIGIAAAYGVALAARRAYAEKGDYWRDIIAGDLDVLARARPTAVNLQWALDRMRRRFAGIEGDPTSALLAEAQAIHDEDVAANQSMGCLGAQLIDDAMRDGAQETCRVLTHCNAGALATGGYGTALGVVRSAWRQGRVDAVYVSESRPWLQGARLTAWELTQAGIPAIVLVDAASAYLQRQGLVRWLIVGADRIAANGDVCNKIGTCSHALAARQYGVKVMVVAPTSSFDATLDSGDSIPVEYRAEDEILSYSGVGVAPQGVGAWNPVFDITPASLIDYIVTEKGIIAAPDAHKIAGLVSSSP